MAAKKKKSAKKNTKAKAKPKKKTAKKKAAPKKKVAAPKKPKITTVNKPRTKSQILSTLAETSGLSKKEVTNVFDSLNALINADIGKRGPGQFTVPGLMKIVRVHKTATKARKGTNPFTGEEMVFKAKPARNVVKVRPLKGLKEMV